MRILQNLILSFHNLLNQKVLTIMKARYLDLGMKLKISSHHFQYLQFPVTVINHYIQMKKLLSDFPL